MSSNLLALPSADTFLEGLFCPAEKLFGSILSFGSFFLTLGVDFLLGFFFSLLDAQPSALTMLDSKLANRSVILHNTSNPSSTVGGSIFFPVIISYTSETKSQLHSSNAFSKSSAIFI